MKQNFPCINFFSVMIIKGELISLGYKFIKKEIRNIQAGIRGENEASYEMKVHYGESKNWMVINDLRIEHGDLAAQIDHLLINRFMEMYI